MVDVVHPSRPEKITVFKLENLYRTRFFSQEVTSTMVRVILALRAALFFTFWQNRQVTISWLRCWRCIQAAL